MIEKIEKRYCDVTVIIPCYNDYKYINESLNSAINQTLKVKEIIIIDDGSGIETKNFLKGIDVEGVTIIYIENGGVSKARNLGISRAKTKYILCLDADDYFELTFVEKAVNILNINSNVGIVGCFYRAFGNNKSEIIETKGGTIKDFLVKNCGLGNSMFRKECWVQAFGYDESMIHGYEDWEFSISILKNDWEMYIIEEVLFNYRLKNISRDTVALKNFDFDLRMYIYLKHKQVFLDNFEFFSGNLIKENSYLRKFNTNIQNSLDYRTGNVILAPFRFLKKITNKK